MQRTILWHKFHHNLANLECKKAGNQIKMNWHLVDCEGKFCQAEANDSKTHQEYPAKQSQRQSRVQFNVMHVEVEGLSSCEYLAGLPIMN